MLSIDAGGIAHMSYNYQHPQQTLEAPGNGFASRGKGQHIRRIQVPTPQDSYTMPANPTPRSTSRAQLLAGLRTAPKTPTSASLADGNRMMDPTSAYLQPPRTAHPVGFTQTGRGNGNHGGHQQQQQYHQHHQNPYSNSPPHMEHPRVELLHQNMRNPLPTPPSSSPSGSISSDAEYEASVYAGLVAQNLQLAQQQQLLQQRVRNVQAQNLQRQLQQLQISTPSNKYGTPPISPAFVSNDATMMYTQQQAMAVQYGYQGSVHNMPVQQVMSPQQYEVDNSYGVQMPAEDMAPGSRSKSRSPASSNSSNSSVRLSPPLREKPKMERPKRGHKKCSSLSMSTTANLAVVDSGPKTSVPKLPPTPSQSTFGGRGDHPLRQPRGPPSLEELVTKPTSKHEGSKNFATRQRRRALSKLVNAGIERRVARSTEPRSTMAPVSENEIDLILEDADKTPPPSGRRSSLGLRVDENDRPVSSRQNGGSTPLLVLSAAEKRKSAIF